MHRQNFVKIRLLGTKLWACMSRPIRVEQPHLICADFGMPQSQEVTYNIQAQTQFSASLNMHIYHYTQIRSKVPIKQIHRKNLVKIRWLGTNLSYEPVCLDQSECSSFIKYARILACTNPRRGTYEVSVETKFYQNPCRHS